MSENDQNPDEVAFIVHNPSDKKNFLTRPLSEEVDTALEAANKPVPFAEKRGSRYNRRSTTVKMQD